jgi:hypothetical protein
MDLRVGRDRAQPVLGGEERAPGRQQADDRLADRVDGA